MKTNNQKPVKIIQILQDVDPDYSFNILVGLGDDGVVYTAKWGSQEWRQLIPSRFEATCKLKSKDE